MIEMNPESILDLLRGLSQKYHLEDFKAEKAVILSPFGQSHFDGAVRHLKESKAIDQMIRHHKLCVILVTSINTNIAACPKPFKVVPIEPVSQWPDHPCYLSRLIKWGIPFLFPNIRSSIYIDADFVITDSVDKMERFFREIDQRKCLITEHEIRNGWQDEYEHILQAARFLDRSRLDEQYEYYQSITLPATIPVFATGLIGRRHRTKFDSLGLTILSQVAQYSERDQLALVYAIAKSQLCPFRLRQGEILRINGGETLSEDSVCFIEKDTYEKLSVSSLTPFFPKVRGFRIGPRMINRFLQRKTPYRVRLFYQVYRLSECAKKLVQKTALCETAEMVNYVFGSLYFQPEQKKSEILNLILLLKSRQPKNICEIGTRAGGCLFLFAQIAAPNARIFSIDKSCTPVQQKAFPHFAREKQEIVCIPADSHEPKTAVQLEKLLAGEKLDFLFIDGDHSWEGVSKDYDMYKSLVRPAGLIAFHDIVSDFKTRYGMPTPSDTGEVPRFWAHLKKQFPDAAELIEDPDQDGYGIGVLKVL